MKLKSNIKNIKNSSYDYPLFIAIIILLFFGLIMVISSSSFLAENKFNDKNFFIIKEVKNILVALVAFVIGVVIKYKNYNKKFVIYGMVGITILLLGYLLVSNFGTSIKGAKRWIFGFQPSEIAKLTTIFFLAYFLSNKRDKLKEWFNGYFIHLGFLGIIVGLVFMQPAFSTSMMIFFIGYIMFYVSGMKVWHLLSASILLVPLILLMAVFQPYRVDRLKSFMNPTADVSGSGYQIEQAIMSIGNGGIKGVGLGESRQKEFYVPEPHNDAIFSIIGDELGFVGTFLLVLTYLFIVFRGFRIATRAVDFYGFMLASGITVSIVLYALFHMGINMGIVPPTGIALPLISYGGSSLILTMFSLGVLLNISYVSNTTKK